MSGSSSANTQPKPQKTKSPLKAGFFICGVPRGTPPYSADSDYINNDCNPLILIYKYLMAIFLIQTSAAISVFCKIVDQANKAGYNQPISTSSCLAIKLDCERRHQSLDRQTPDQVYKGSVMWPVAA